MIYKSVLVACMALSANSFAPRTSSSSSKNILSVDTRRTTAAAVVSSKLLRMAVTDAPPKMEVSSPMSGMFTNSSPETKRVVPANLDGKVKFKIVYVVLESQYQSALTKACNKINEGKEGVAVEAVGYLLEELRNPENLEAFKRDVADANIFIGSLIFVQELADKVVEVLTPQRDRMDAVLIFPSMPEVMRLNKVGSFSMTSLGQSKSVIGEFMKKKKKEDGSSFEEGMLKLLRTLPKVLKFLPSDKAKDARSFMMSFQYWLGGSPDNLESMLLMLAKDFVKGAQVSDASIAEPVVIADKGIWHPMADGVFETYEEYTAWYDKVHCPAAGIDAKTAVTVGLVLQKSHINTKDECHYTAVISELEARGAKVVCIYSGGLDFSGPIDEYFYSSNRKVRSPLQIPSLDSLRVSAVWSLDSGVASCPLVISHLQPSPHPALISNPHS